MWLFPQNGCLYAQQLHLWVVLIIESMVPCKKYIMIGRPWFWPTQLLSHTHKRLMTMMHSVLFHICVRWLVLFVPLDWWLLTRASDHPGGWMPDCYLLSKSSILRCVDFDFYLFFSGPSCDILQKSGCLCRLSRACGSYKVHSHACLVASGCIDAGLRCNQPIGAFCLTAQDFLFVPFCEFGLPCC